MGLRKFRPCGAVADVKELEYISALMQTGKNHLREDGSIAACDIVAFLMSRHGIKVSELEVIQKILCTFGDSVVDEQIEEDDDELQRSNDERNEEDELQRANKERDESLQSGCIDLIQILAMLIIPTLLKAKQSLVENASSTPQSSQASNSIRGESTSSCLEIHDSQKDDKRWPDSDIIQRVLRMMLHDATGDSAPRPLTKDLIQQLLCFYGEVEASQNEELVADMALAACSDTAGCVDNEGEPILFDQNTFIDALTKDLDRYNIDCENRVDSTHFDDVFQDELNGDLKEGQSVKTVRTLMCIDYTADTFRSKSFVVVLWVAWILTYFSYLETSQILSFAKLQCDPLRFECTLAQGIVNWFIIMFELSILGSAFAIVASAGNVSKANLLLVTIGICPVILFIIFPFFHNFSFWVLSTEKDSAHIKQVLYHLSVICGFILLIDPVLYVIKRILPMDSLHKHTDPNTRLEAQIKQASSFKINRLLRNACDVHKMAELNGGVRGHSETKYGMSMLAYAKLSDYKEQLARPRQIWKEIIWSGHLFDEEGIWLTTHVLSGNLAQVTVCVLLAALFISFYTSEPFQQGLDYLDDLSVVGQSQRWRLLLPLIFGFIFGELTIISIISKYIPSAVNTIIQFRTGGYESLKGGASFLKLRFAVDNSSLLFGSIFWGTFYTSILVGVFMAVLLGICLWPDFAEVVGVLFANIIGIFLTVMLKWVVLVCFRRFNSQGYYRRSVALNNVVNIVLESWNLALTSSYMIIRSLYFLLAAILYIGRVDVPFLSEDACFVGPFELDSFPLVFKKDLLAHEAHRHPYIERLGVMYMLKLKCDDFGTRAGTYWRLLFIHALMPWMQKYRRNKDENLHADLNVSANRIWTGRMPSPKEAKIATDDPLQKLKQENELLRTLLFRFRQGGGPNTGSCPPIFHTDIKEQPPRLDSTNTI